MVELGIRLAVAALAAAGAWWLQSPQAPLVGQIAAGTAALTVFLWQLQRRELRGPGTSALAGCLDAIALAATLGALGRLESLGFLVLAPLAFAASHHGALPTAMAPLAAGSVVAAHSLFSSAAAPGFLIGLQAAGILATGLLLNHRRIVVTVAQPVLPDPIEPMDAGEPDEVLELRESFRKLKEVYRDLEHRSRRDRLAIALLDAKQISGERFYKALTMKLRELTGVQGLALYTMAQFADRLVVQAVCGDYPSGLRDASIDVDLRHSGRQIASNALQSLKALAVDTVEPRMDNVLLKTEGRVIGMVCLVDPSGDALAEGVETVEAIAEAAAGLIQEEIARGRTERRMREAELLYELAGSMVGAKTPAQVAARVVRELWPMLDVDHVGAWFVEGEDLLMAGNEGASLRLIDAMTFAGGPGVKGWLRTGAPELVLHEAAEDSRLTPQEALKRRVGSYALAPIQFGEQPFGFLTVATHRSGGIDLDDVELLRAVAHECGHTIARMLGQDLESSGLATGPEFQAAIAQAERAHLVHFETIRRAQIVEHLGRPAFENAMRQFARKLRAKLPANSLLCRRKEGDFVVLLRGVSTDFAESWSNEVCALASFVSFRMPEGTSRVPLALKAKVATLNPQNRQNLPAETAQPA